MTRFNQGARVEAFVGGTWKPGTINYARLLGPEYREPAAYSVLLDERMNGPSYAGTIVKAEDVRAAPELSDDQRRTVEDLGEIEKALNRKGWSMEEP